MKNACCSDFLNVFYIVELVGRNFRKIISIIILWTKQSSIGFYLYSARVISHGVWSVLNTAFLPLWFLQYFLWSILGQQSCNYCELSALLTPALPDFVRAAPQWSLCMNICTASSIPPPHHLPPARELQLGKQSFRTCHEGRTEPFTVQNRALILKCFTTRYCTNSRGFLNPTKPTGIRGLLH